MIAQYPFVVAGVPVYNGAAFLREALDSLVAQDYANLRIVISDNGSTDETSAICEEYAQRHPAVTYSRVRHNMGATWNFNHLLAITDGDYFFWAAHDDVLLPSFVTRAVERLVADPGAVICHSYGQPVGASGQRVGLPYTEWVNEKRDRRSRYRYTLEHWELHAAIYGLLRRDALDRTRGLRPIVAGDIVFISEMAIWGTIVQVPEALQLKRVPDVGEAYRTHREMLSYLTGRPLSRALVVARRLRASAECVAGVLHARLGPRLSAQLILDTVVVYLRQGYWATDLAECAESLLGRDRYLALRARLPQSGDRRP